MDNRKCQRYRRKKKKETTTNRIVNFISNINISMGQLFKGEWNDDKLKIVRYDLHSMENTR